MFVAIDTETHLITPLEPVPKLVCVSFYAEGKPDGILLARDEGAAAFLKLLQGKHYLIFANAAFDIRVLARYYAERGLDIWPIIVAAYDADRVIDIQLVEGLQAIAEGRLGRTRDGQPAGRYSLETLTRQYLGTEAKENDEYRLRYAELEHLPIDSWPWVARQYPIDDVKNAMAVWKAQLAGPRVNAAFEGDTVRAHLAMSDSPGWEIDAEAVAALKAKYEARKADPSALLAYGLLTQDGKANRGELKRRLAKAHGCSVDCAVCSGLGFVSEAKVSEKTGRLLKPTTKNCKACDSTGLFIQTSKTLPLSEGGGVSIARDNLDETDDDALHLYSQYSEGDKILQTYIPAFEECLALGVPLTASPNVLLETLRASYSGLLQTMPRAAGLRECIRARKGKVICSSDYAGIEMVSFAQACLDIVGESSLADAINGGKDAHSILGAKMTGLSYEAFYAERKGKNKKPRDAAKAGNFGLPGGMGELTFVIAKRKEPGVTTTGSSGKIHKGIRFCILMDGAERCGIEMLTEYKGRDVAPVCKHCVECARRLREDWFATWTGAKKYLEWAGQVTDVEHGGSEVVTYPFGFTRGGLGFCDAANTGFQSAAAIGAKRALWLCWREMRAVPSSPLYGGTMNAFVHDEFLCEFDESTAHEACVRLRELQIAGMDTVLTKVQCDAEPALMRRLSKAAEAKYENGRLVTFD